MQVDACFKKFDADKDGMMNFVEFKNFMGKRKSLPDKVGAVVIDIEMGVVVVSVLVGVHCAGWFGEASMGRVCTVGCVYLTHTSKTLFHHNHGCICHI